MSQSNNTSGAVMCSTILSSLASLLGRTSIVAVSASQKMVVVHVFTSSKTRMTSGKVYLAYSMFSKNTHRKAYPIEVIIGPE